VGLVVSVGKYETMMTEESRCDGSHGLFMRNLIALLSQVEVLLGTRGTEIRLSVCPSLLLVLNFEIKCHAEANFKCEFTVQAR
jgi:hypothetical protein